MSSGYRPGRLVDDGTLAQVFLASPAGQVVEHISRRDPTATATFTCANVEALSVSEEVLTGSLEASK